MLEGGVEVWLLEAQGNWGRFFWTEFGERKEGWIFLELAAPLGNDVDGHSDEAGHGPALSTVAGAAVLERFFPDRNLSLRLGYPLRRFRAGGPSGSSIVFLTAAGVFFILTYTVDDRLPKVLQPAVYGFVLLALIYVSRLVFDGLSLDGVKAVAQVVLTGLWLLFVVHATVTAHVMRALPLYPLARPC